MAQQIQFKRIYDPQTPDDGLRVLCTAMWPRGVKKTAVDRWYRELGAPRDIIRPYLDGQVSWEEFRQRVWESLHTPEAQKALAELAEEVRQGRTVTLLTSVRDAVKTHLEIIADALQAHL
ncbi:uncharacterized protein YeaO (DUF488 family) [Symbiobacterium terraclitae]|uniref:Uncharacterized protein YeaO (DUF488 family) n=1 Tax=Symbiobacterium terraclitae TaxID=557451 RepID=A0ABS4JNM7_9FIRM|nr:DUF488 family protein [Symbiobacterium terraclitae]MBP2017124.1 uncharacterized protein YeaO (DUF488 family) [Symbiobacterium terraclitae]